MQKQIIKYNSGDQVNLLNVTGKIVNVSPSKQYIHVDDGSMVTWYHVGEVINSKQLEHSL